MKLDRLPLVLLLTLALPLLLGVAARGQEELDTSQATLHSQLERLNDNIERIAMLLERSLQGQQLDLLIQRVEMGASRLAVAEQNLRSAQATRATLDNEKSEIEARLTQIAQRARSRHTGNDIGGDRAVHQGTRPAAAALEGSAA